MSETDSILKLLGFARRANKLTLGMGATLQGMKRGKVRWVIVASDASQNTKEAVKGAADLVRARVHTMSSKSELGQRLGRQEIAVLGIADPSFVKSIRQILE